MAYKKDKKNTPVFVVGSARSGTRILSRLIREYLHISFGTESQFIVRFYKQLTEYGNLNNEKNLKMLLCDIGDERCFKRWRKFGYKIDLNRIYARIENRSYSGLLDAIFTDLAVHNKMLRWGDKTPEYINNLEILYRLFPNAKFIHIVRDGRDVALSSFKIHFGAKNIGVAALEWSRQIECILKFKQCIPPCQFIEIRYEDFLKYPEHTFSELITFLEIDDPQGEIQARIEENLGKEIYRNNYFKWKTQLNKDHQILFEKVNYKYLQIYNYPTVTNGAEKITLVEKMFWKFDHKAKQLGRLDTWLDNMYKLNLRTRHIRKKIQRRGNLKW